MIGEFTNPTNRAQAAGLTSLVWAIGFTIGCVTVYMSAAGTILTDISQPFSRRVALPPARKISDPIRKLDLGGIPISPAVSVLRDILWFLFPPHVAVLERGQRTRRRLCKRDSSRLCLDRERTPPVAK